MKLQRIPVRSLYKRNKKISDIETTRDKIEKYLYANIATLFWTSFLLLGGIIFVAYYAHIGYMPDFDLKSSITITAAVAVTGVVSVIVLMITMVLPSIIWVEYWGSTSILKNNWSDKSGNPTFIGIVIWFVLPLLFTYGAVVAAYYGYWYVSTIGAVIFVGLIFYVSHKNRLTFWLAVTETIKFIFVIIFSSSLIWLPLSFVLLLTLHNDGGASLNSSFAGIVVAVFIVFANCFATLNPKNIKKLYWLAGIGATTLFVMLFAFSNFYRIPLGVMQLYKFGNIQTTELVLKKEACKAFSSLKIEVIEYGTDICVAKNILILSRLGKDAYLQYKNEQKTVKFTISTDQIVSWAIQKANDDIGKKE